MARTMPGSRSDQRPRVPQLHARAVTDSKLSAQAHIGGVRLQVADLGRSLAFYRDVVGLTEIDRQASTAMLGDPDRRRPLVTLSERPGAKPVSPRGRLGLFHFAILLPTRGALASTLAHL